MQDWAVEAVVAEAEMGQMTPERAVEILRVCGGEIKETSPIGEVIWGFPDSVWDVVQCNQGGETSVMLWLQRKHTPVPWLSQGEIEEVLEEFGDVQNVPLII